MPVFFKALEFDTVPNKPQYFEIRQACRDFVAETGVTEGVLTIQSPHTTCSVFFEEMVHDFDAKGDEFLQVDLNKHLDRVFPKQLEFDGSEYNYPGPKHIEYAYEVEAEEFGANPAILLNGDAHLKATTVGSSIQIIIHEGKLMTGTYGFIYFVDFDGNRPRHRRCLLNVMGE